MSLILCLFLGHDWMCLPMTAADHRIVEAGYSSYSPTFCDRCGKHRTHSP